VEYQAIPFSFYIEVAKLPDMWVIVVMGPVWQRDWLEKEYVRRGRAGQLGWD
jgi:hypothetical protein